MTTSLTFFPVSGDYQAVDDVEVQATTSAPRVEGVQGLAVFTARVPKGFTAYVADYQISHNNNSIQTIRLIGAITGGTYGLEFGGVWTPTGISPSASAATIQTALEALSSVGVGNVHVTGANPLFQAEFIGALGNSPQPQMLSDPTDLTVSSGTPHVEVVMLQPGSVSRVAPTAIAIPPRIGRIWTTGRLSSINVTDSPNVELVSNIPALGLPFDLIYDVTFSAVRFNGINRDLAPFAFLAPVDASAICLTDPSLERLKYQPPLADTWYPGWMPTAPAGLAVVGGRNWRQAG